MMINNKEKELNSGDIVHLFWTGGWDSTFRLLQLIFLEKAQVQPHYIIRGEPSSGQEVQTIIKIRKKLRRNFPKIAELLLPVKFIDVRSLPENKKIAERHEKLTTTQKVNSQYLHLAKYCYQENLQDVELSILKRDSGFLEDDLLFGKFSFPLLGKTKKEIAEISLENGWMDLMKLTRFCRRPKKGKACGLCGPCSDAVEAGMGWRLPLRARLIANLQLPFRKYWRNNYKKQGKGLLKYIPTLLKNRY